MQNSDQGRIDLLERALVEYIERYGMTDAAALAMRPCRPDPCHDQGKPKAARFLRPGLAAQGQQPKNQAPAGLPKQMAAKVISTLRAKAQESTQS